MDLKEKIIQEIRIDHYIGQYTKLLRQSPMKMKGLCPFHQEKTPSFTVDLGKSLFYCFGCHKGGDLFHFAMEMDRLDFSQALKKLAQYAGIEVRPKKALTRAEWQKIRRQLVLKAVMQECQQFLPWNWHGKLPVGSAELTEESESKKITNLSKPAQQYLARRGLEAEVCQTFQLGFFPEAWKLNDRWLHQVVRRAQKSIEKIETNQPKYLKSGLSSAPFELAEIIQYLEQTGVYMKSSFANDSQISSKWSPYAGRILFPLIDTDQQVCSFGGRSLSDEKGKPKYLNGRETNLFQKKKYLYGLAQNGASIRHTRTAIIVEGYLDVLCLWQAGLPQACAPLGSAMSAEHLQILAKRADSLIFMFDGDLAGIASVLRILPELWRHSLPTKALVFPLPPDTDPGDLAKPISDLLRSDAEKQQVDEPNHASQKIGRAKPSQAKRLSAKNNPADKLHITTMKLHDLAVSPERFFILENLQPGYFSHLFDKQTAKTYDLKKLAEFFRLASAYYNGNAKEHYPQGVAKLESLRLLCTALLDITDETRRIILLEEAAIFLQLSSVAVRKEWEKFLQSCPSHRRKMDTENKQTENKQTENKRPENYIRQKTIGISETAKLYVEEVEERKKEKGVQRGKPRSQSSESSIPKQMRLLALLEQKTMLYMLMFPELWPDFYEKILALEPEDFKSNILFRILEEKYQQGEIWSSEKIVEFPVDDETKATFVEMMKQESWAAADFEKVVQARESLEDLCLQWENAKLKNDNREVLNHWESADIQRGEGKERIVKNMKRISENQKTIRSRKRKSVV